MKYIRKFEEPISLRNHRRDKINQNDLTYKNLPSAIKNELNTSWIQLASAIHI